MKRVCFAAVFSLLSACEHSAEDHSQHGADAARAADSVEASTGDADAVTGDAAGDAATDDAAATVPLLNDCREADYVDRREEGAARTVVPRGSTGYTPRCVIVSAGQTVRFEMAFGTHPLVPGVPHGSSAGASTPSPIVAQRSGDQFAATFARAGYYPFYCDTHGHVGMAGVVRVVP